MDVVKSIKTIEELKDYIMKRYDNEDVGGSWGDTGNYDDSYDYRRTNGTTWTLYEIGSLIGLDILAPDEVEPV